MAVPVIVAVVGCYIIDRLKRQGKRDKQTLLGQRVFLGID